MCQDALAKAIDDGEDSDDDEARAHEYVADEEDEDDEAADESEARGTQWNLRVPARRTARDESGGITCAVVMPMRAETGTIL